MGALPGLTLFLGYNMATTGHPLTSPYALTVGNPLGVANFLSNMRLFGESLLAVYPLMLFSLVMAWRRHMTVAVALAAFTLFHGLLPTGWILGNQSGDLLQRLPLQLRYLLPSVPLFLMCYVWALDQVAARVAIPMRRLLPLIAVLLVTVATIIHSRHQTYLHELADFQKVVYSDIPREALVMTNHDGMRLFNDIFGKRRWVLVSGRESGEKPGKSDEVFFIELGRQDGSRAPDSAERPLLQDRQSVLRLMSRLDRQTFSLSIYRVQPRHRGAEVSQF
jgi:hypothetical protein